MLICNPYINSSIIGKILYLSTIFIGNALCKSAFVIKGCYCAFIAKFISDSSTCFIIKCPNSRTRFIKYICNCACIGNSGYFSSIIYLVKLLIIRYCAYISALLICNPYINSSIIGKGSDLPILFIGDSISKGTLIMQSAHSPLIFKGISYLSGSLIVKLSESGIWFIKHISDCGAIIYLGNLSAIVNLSYIAVVSYRADIAICLIGDPPCNRAIIEEISYLPTALIDNISANLPIGIVIKVFYLTGIAKGIIH